MWGNYDQVYYNNDDSLKIWSDGYAEGTVVGADGKQHSYTAQFEFVRDETDEDGYDMDCFSCLEVSDVELDIPFRAGENYYFDTFYTNEEYGGDDLDTPYDKKKDIQYNVVVEIKDKNMEKTGYDCKYFSPQR